MSMLWIFIFCSFAVPLTSNPLEPTLIYFDHMYKNFTTKGKLYPDLFEVASCNDTRQFAVRVFFESKNASRTNPITLLLMRGSSILPTVLPRTQTFEGNSTDFYFLAETLCEDRNLRNHTYTEFNETLRVSVSSSVPMSYELMVKKVYGYNLGMDPVNVSLSPSQPEFYRFTFPKDVDQIAIRVTSNDDVCGRVTIQEANCPVFDTEGQVVLYGFYEHQTVTKNGFIIVKRKQFGGDIHVIFAVLPYDDSCRSKNLDPFFKNTASQDNPDRIKNLTAIVKPFEPNQYSIYAMSVLYAGLLLIAVFAVYRYRVPSNNRNPEDTYGDGTIFFWHLSLSQCFVILPLTLVVVSIKYSDFSFSSDTDTCNYNFECSTPWGPFKAFNNVLSASSIAVAAIINVAASLENKRWRRPFPLNMCIFLTGMLWVSVNFCPQKHSYHLYTMAMIMTVLEAKFFLFGKRNGRKLIYHTYIGSYTLIIMVIVIFDAVVDKYDWNIYFPGVLFFAEISFSAVFSYIHGAFERIRENRETQTFDILSSTETEHLPILQSSVSSESVTDMVENEETPGTSSQADNPLFTEDVNEFEIEIPSIAEPMSPPHEAPTTGNESDRTSRNLKLIYFSFSIANIIFWASIAFVIWPRYDLTSAVLRIVQIDFALYFLFYCINKVGEPYFLKLSAESFQLNRVFYATTILFTICISAWWYISTYRLPSSVTWSPAESRNLNTACLSEPVGMDFHDILNYLSAVICMIYPIIINHIDDNLSTNEPLKNF